MLELRQAAEQPDRCSLRRRPARHSGFTSLQKGSIELLLDQTKLVVRRADGREHEKLCSWAERPACGLLPPLQCGSLALPQ